MNEKKRLEKGKKEEERGQKQDITPQVIFWCDERGKKARGRKKGEKK